MDRCCSCCGVGGQSLGNQAPARAARSYASDASCAAPGGPQQVAVQQQPIGWRLRPQRRLGQGHALARHARIEPQGEPQLPVALVVAARVVGEARRLQSGVSSRGALGRRRGRCRGRRRAAERRASRGAVGWAAWRRASARASATGRRRAGARPRRSPPTRSRAPSGRWHDPGRRRRPWPPPRPAARSAGAAPGCPPGWRRSPRRRRVACPAATAPRPAGHGPHPARPGHGRRRRRRPAARCAAAGCPPPARPGRP